MDRPARSRSRLRAAAIGAVIAGLALVAGAVAFVRMGIYNVAADDPHSAVTHSVLTQLRDASVAARAQRVHVPTDVASEARIIQGAGNYDAMCTQCHLAPGSGPTELSRGLYPSPPDLTRHAVEAAEAFWVIKHGIKASGMPAWGHSMDDVHIWNMAAFLQRLPELDAAQYRALVARSDGHSHGGGESMPHAQGGAAGDEDHHAAPSVQTDRSGQTPHAAGRPDHPHPPATPQAHVDPPGAPPHTH